MTKKLLITVSLAALVGFLFMPTLSEAGVLTGRVTKSTDATKGISGVDVCKAFNDVGVAYPTAEEEALVCTKTDRDGYYSLTQGEGDTDLWATRSGYGPFATTYVQTSGTVTQDISMTPTDSDIVPPKPKTGGGAGCFLAGTPILMGDGSFKAIEEVKVGDLVMAFDEKKSQMKPDKVKELLFHPKEEGYLIINGHLKVTPVHRVLSKGRWVEIGSLKVGDTLTNTQGEDAPIESIKVVNGPVDVYNFEVNPYHTYVAGGFIVHNAKAKVK